MSKILAVAWRDFKHTVLTKAFIFAVVGLPILMIGISVVAGFLVSSHKAPALEGTLAVITDNGDVAAEIAEQFEPERIAADTAEAISEATDAIMEQLPEQIAEQGRGQMEATATGALGRGEISVQIEAHGTDADAEVIRQRVRDGELLALATIPPTVLESPDPDMPRGDRPRFDLLVDDDVAGDHVSTMEDRIGLAIRNVRARNQGLDPRATSALLRYPRSNTSRALETGEDTSEGEGMREIRQMLIPAAFMFLLWIGVFTAGQQLMMSTIEEKSNKVIEVLLSAISSLQLMTGKIIGQGAVGLLLIVVYAGVSLIALFSLQQMNLIRAMDMVYLAVFFVMAYFMVASLMAAVGSAVSDIREANTLVTPVMLVLMVPLMLWMPISQAPNGAIAIAFSYIPPATPFAMILRVTAEEPIPAWQIITAVIWGFICVIAMVWMAAKIFRVGVLMTGKPPSPIELIKWMRYS